MKKSIEAILIVSFIFFGIASAVTTFLGVLLVLESYDEYLKFGLSVLISLATSGVMLYIGFSVPRFRKDGRLILVVFAYAVIASLSIFFNFVTFYQGQIMSRTIDEDIRILNSELTYSFENAKNQLEVNLNRTSINDSVVKYEAAAKSEEEHALRPGRKKRWQKLKEKQNHYEIQLKNIDSTYNNRVKDINDIYINGKELINIIRSDDKAEIKINYAEEVVKSVDELNIISKSLNPEFVYNSYKLESTSVKKPDYILQKVVDILTVYETIEGKAKTRFAISLFLSILLDMPIFITLLLLGSDMTVSRKEYTIWD